MSNSNIEDEIKKYKVKGIEVMKYIVNEKNNIVDISSKEVIIFGAGYYGGKILPYMLKYDEAQVCMVFDNDPRKHDKMVWEKIPCTSPKLIDENVPIIIAIENMEAREMIKKQCEELGYLYIYYVDVAGLKDCVTMLPDKQFLELQYYLRLGKTLDISSPESFNEKLQWLKLYDRKPEYHLLVDKYEVKRIVADKIGEEYIIPTLGVWNSFDEIDFDKLPSRFVLKCTHDSGSTVICKDKETFNQSEAKEKLELHRNTDFYKLCREWVYKDIQPRIIAEAYIENVEAANLYDYKIYCFHGKAEYIQIIGDRTLDTHQAKEAFYNTKWQLQPFVYTYPRYTSLRERPKNLDEMIRIAEILSKDTIYVRIDLYDLAEGVRFGEMTFIPASGYDSWDPPSADIELGKKIVLPFEKY